jgi:hypothetical protein
VRFFVRRRRAQKKLNNPPPAMYETTEKQMPVQLPSEMDSPRPKPQSSLIELEG